MPDPIQLVVVTPEKQLLRQNVTEVQLPGANGELGVLPGHAPLMTELGIGELTYKPVFEKRDLATPSGTSQAEYHPDPADLTFHLAIIGGFAEVLADRVTVLAETAERVAEIDLARAERAVKRAQERLASGDPNLDWDRATIALQRALIRIQVARKRPGVAIEQH